MPANYINFVTSLVYGDLGTAELGPPPAGATNYLTWTLDRLAAPPPPATRGDNFLNHHLDVMLAQYVAWRSKYFLPPVRPWDGSNVFPHPADLPVGPPIPAALNGGPYPAGWTTNDLGTAVESYYNTLRNFINAGRTTELDDEIKAPFSYRYWALLKWVADLRSRLLGQPVFPVAIVYDRDGTILSEKDFTDYFNQVHHVWHPNAGTPGAAADWTDPTPGFKTSVGQHRRKKEISRTQIGAEFFEFHRDHLLLIDRWLARTGQDPVQSINICAHDTTGPALPTPPAGLDVNGGGSGYPVVNYVTRTINFAPPHNNMWDGTRAGFDGTLREFASLGEMGQFFARDFNPFDGTTTAKSTFGTMIPVPGAAGADAGYHGPGHNLNGDIRTPFANNYVPRFHAWHGFIDDVWAKRQPQYLKFEPVMADGVTKFSSPQVLTILREFAPAADSVEPANGILGINLTTGNGTLRCRIRVRPDPFGRQLDLKLECEVLREAGGPAPVIALPARNLIITPGAPGAPNERQQNVDFVEDFVFDGTAGTTDGGGKGPFASDNLNFPPIGPSAVGVLNSLIRVRGTLVCKAKPDGSIPVAAGTISSAGTAVTGAGTAFTTLFRQGDLIRAAGQVRLVALISSATSLTVLTPFGPTIPVGTVFERLDGFDEEKVIEIPLLQEKQAPDITVYLDRSSFSKDQVDAVVAAGQSVFENSFYVILQDRTARPAPIVWPADTEPQLFGIIAPPVRAAGLNPDLAHSPKVELRDAVTNASLAGQVDVAITAADPEDPALHPSVPQRITYRCRVTFTGNGVFVGMVAGDVKDMKLVITALDRSGNTVTNDATRVRLQINANPYMLDGPTSWLSIDTRVFKVKQGDARFGVSAGWSNPNTFITQVIANLRAGGGTAGGESFDGLPTDQEASVLEYSTQVGGFNFYNFALAKVRLQSVSGAVGVRASFRLFRWGVANVSFDNTLAYRTAPGGVALLGRTTADEMASIPFYAAPRVPITASLATQVDPKNLFDFPPTGAAEAVSFFGAYLDINQSTVQFPKDFLPALPDGPFNTVPAGDMRSIRDLLISNHQCMVVEIFYPPDPTVSGSTPGSSDNLSQRNLLILRTANPGSEETRTIQHSFNIDLTRRRKRLPSSGHLMEIAVADEDVPMPARPADSAGHSTQSLFHTFDHVLQTNLGSDPEVLAEIRERIHAAEQEIARWQFDMDYWKPTDGLDEMVFFWNNLPKDAEVEVYLPGAGVEEIFNYRSLRHGPGTVKIVDSHTLRLQVGGPVYLPIPPFWGDNLAGLVTVKLPAGIKERQEFLIDVVQLRSDTRRVLGGFQINIQVSKALNLIEAAKRTLSLFHRRLELTPRINRWRPILEREVNFLRRRARGLVELANDPGIRWEDPTERQKGQNVRLVLERIQILDDQDPFLKGEGEFRFGARVHSRNNGVLLQETRFPEKSYLSISDKPGRNIVQLNLPLFEGFVEDHLAVEITGLELDTFDPDDELCRYRRVFNGPPESWLGSFGPGDEKIEPENLGDWRVWYRIERA